MTGNNLTTGGAVTVDVTDEELRVLRDTLNPDLSPTELRLFAVVARRTGLDPFARQLYAIKRRGRVTFQTSIDGYRSIAARTGEYDGQEEPAYGPPCGCGEAPTGHPEWATVRVFRRGMGRGVAATAFWHEYKPAPGPSGEQDGMWRRMPRVMLAKVAEAAALRKAFPWVLADVYTADEMDQAEAVPAPPTLNARERLAARRAALHPSEPPAIDLPERPRPDAGDHGLAAPELTRQAFLEAVRAAGTDREAVAEAAAELFPGIASRQYTDRQWGALGAQLELLPAAVGGRLTHVGLETPPVETTNTPTTEGQRIGGTTE